MKKYLIGFVVGAILFVPMGAVAWNKNQMARPIYGADCMRATEANEKHYGKDGLACSVTIFVFDDAGNKCYLAKGSNGTGLSCVQGGAR